MALISISTLTRTSFTFFSHVARSLMQCQNLKNWMMMCQSILRVSLLCHRSFANPHVCQIVWERIARVSSQWVTIIVMFMTLPSTSCQSREKNEDGHPPPRMMVVSICCLPWAHTLPCYFYLLLIFPHLMQRYVPMVAHHFIRCFFVF